MQWTAASILAVVAGIGTPMWYARAQGLNDPALATLPLPRRQLPAPSPVIAMPSTTEDLAQASPVDVAAQVTSMPPVVSSEAAATSGTYSILVASFRSVQAADRVVEELTNAGFGAHAVDRSGGPGRGVFKLVVITGYNSALDVQRDLQRIRALPGGYSDARIVDRQ
jgi:cell division septation protein DedD